jgi:hypothetical protein
MNTRASQIRRERRIEKKQAGPATRSPRTALEIPPQHPPAKFPAPWQYDTHALIQDLDKARELVLAIPLHNDTFGPTNTAAGALWELRERLFYLAGIVAQKQRDWKKKTAPKSSVRLRKNPEIPPPVQGNDTPKRAAIS